MYTAEEKAALAMINYEEKAEREKKVRCPLLEQGQVASPAAG